ncbi:MAG: HAMP domain-containing sensor histidine kinase [Flavipsychrobacter sp.]
MGEVLLNNITIIGIFILVALIYFVATYRFLKQQRNKKEKLLTLHLERKIKEIERKNIELENLNSIKTRLISIISHDIITPLRFMHLTGRNLMKKNEISPHEYSEILIDIINTSEELEALSKNILNWIKFQNKNRTLVKEDIDLHDIIEEVFGILKPLAKEKNIVLTNKVPEKFVIEQFFEPLKVILYNLVVNAINFMEKGNINISSKVLRNGLLIEVQDQGLGMSQEQIDNLLSEKLFVSTANSKGKQGNGIGYLIIKDLLKVTHGKFIISSAKNRGTKIKLFFPNK